MEKGRVIEVMNFVEVEYVCPYCDGVIIKEPHKVEESKIIKCCGCEKEFIVNQHCIEEEVR